jgi:O-antigen ligase
MLLILVSVGRAHELFQATASLPVGKLLLPIGVFLLLTQQGIQKCLAALDTKQGKFFGLFLFAMIASVPFSIWRGGSTIALKDFVIAQVPYVVILVCAAHSDEEFEWLLWSYTLAVIVFGLVVVFGGGRYSEGRVYASSTYDPNDIALMAAISIPYAVHLLLKRTLVSRVWGVAGLGSALALVLRSGSRGGAVAVGAVLLAYLVMFRRSLPRRMKLALLGAVALAVVVAPGVFLERVASLGNVSDDYNITSPTGRIEIWRRGIGLFLSHPLTGVGLGQFINAEAQVGQEEVAQGEGFRGSTAHNSFLLPAAELGLPGIIGFLGLFLPILPLAVKMRRSAHIDRRLAKVAVQGETLAVAVVCFLTGGFFLSATYGPVAMTLAAFGMSYSAISRNKANASFASPKQSIRGR